MRMRIINKKNEVIEFASHYLQQVVEGKKCDVISNGNKYKGIVSNVYLEREEEHLHFLSLTVDETVITIPFSDDTKAHFGKNELVTIVTDQHSTVIEILQ